MDKPILSMAEGHTNVNIHFSVPRDKMNHIYDATMALFKAGISFDTGGCFNKKSGTFEYDWEFDKSLSDNVKVTPIE